MIGVCDIKVFNKACGRDSGPVHYRVRREGKPAPGTWSPLKKKNAGSLSATETLGPGKYEIDFRVGRAVDSALRLALA